MVSKYLIFIFSFLILSCKNNSSNLDGCFINVDTLIYKSAFNDLLKFQNNFLNSNEIEVDTNKNNLSRYTKIQDSILIILISENKFVNGFYRADSFLRKEKLVEPSINLIKYDEYLEMLPLKNYDFYIYAKIKIFKNLNSILILSDYNQIGSIFKENRDLELLLFNIDNDGNLISIVLMSKYEYLNDGLSFNMEQISSKINGNIIELEGYSYSTSLDLPDSKPDKKYGKLKIRVDKDGRIWKI